MKNLNKGLLLLLIFIMSISLFSQKTYSLEDAMEIAFKNSPAIQLSRLNMEQNKEYLIAELASLKSKFSLNITPLSYSKRDSYNEYFSQWYTSEEIGTSGSFAIDQPIKITDGILSLRNNFGYKKQTSDSTYTGFNNNLYLQYTQPLFTYNRTKMRIERNRLDLENATLAYSIQMLNMEMQVNQSFYTIFQKQMALQIAQEDFSNQEISLEITQDKVNAGLLAQEEIFQAELNYATSQSTVDNSQVDLENAKDQFKKLLGISLYDNFEVVTDVKYKEVIINLEKAIDNGLSQRLELSQRQIDLNNAKFNLIETNAINEFRGDINISVGLMGEDEKFSLIYDKSTKSPQIMLGFSIPLFDWGEQKARLRAAEIQIESTEINIKSLKDDIIIGIRTVYRNLNNLKMQITIAEKNVTNAQLTYDINLERYKNGDLTSMDLELFQNQLSEKKINLANSLINYKLELLNMKIQSLWDFENNISFVPKELQENLIRAKQK